MNASRVELILQELDALPTLPVIATRLLALTSAEDARLSEIVRLIEADPAMTAKVLSLCARASVGVARSITTVDRAVVMLGLNAVKAAVLSVQVVDWMIGMSPARGGGGNRADAAGGSSPGADHTFDPAGLWRHSIAVACCAELICQTTRDGIEVAPSDAFVAGLMHDLGKLALQRALPRAYAKAVELCALQHGDIALYERSILGLDHHEAGKRLAEKWGLPAHLQQAMWLHGNGGRGPLPPDCNRQLVLLVAVADTICRRLHLGWSGNFSAGFEPEELCAQAGIDPARLESVIPLLHQSLSQRCKELGLDDAGSAELLLQSVLAANRQLGRLNSQIQAKSERLAQSNEALAAAQKRLAQAESMARLGELTAGAAHEMNNPLTVISGRAQTLAASLENAKDKAVALSIVGAASKLSDLITRLHAIAVPPTPALEAVSVADLLSLVVREAKARAAARSGKGSRAAEVAVRIVLAGPLPPARLDPALFKQAVEEVVINAIEAGTGGQGGPVELRAEPDPAGDRLFIMVRDGGAGMNEHALKHAFDPFFSHKPAGRQPGLGLPLALRLIGLHGGNITLRSEPGRGTVATIEIPHWRWEGEGGQAARAA
ncbi:MAG: HDOD domain-containing protein [Phycisphaerales bacterium]|nr:HDOD domain-containing protein [Phycisphaerales bacterium]